MEHNYTLNPAVEILLQQIESGSREAPVQAFVEVVLWTVFPAAAGWMTHIKHSQGATEPDTFTAKIVNFNGGYAPVDLLYGELKRLREDTSMGRFNRVSHDQLNDHMMLSANQDGTTLFGLTGIGKHVVFYEKILPNGDLSPLFDRPMHWWDDWEVIQGWFDYFKDHVPSMTSAAPAAPAALAAEPAEPAEPVERFPLQYYYVTEGQYYYSDNGNVRQCSSRPQGEWVFNGNGWSETERTKMWRKANGRRVEYR